MNDLTVVQLDRPLTILDCEATGTDPTTARLIQVAIRRLEPTEGGPVLGDPFVAFVKGVDIPERIQELTGITPERIAKVGSSLEWVMSGVADMVEGCDVAGYNVISYDWPLLKAEFGRTSHAVPGPEDRTLVDAYRLEKALRPRTLSAVYERRTGSAHDGAHTASADVDATVAVLLDQASEVKASEGDGPTPVSLADRARGDYLDDGRKLKKTGDGPVVLAFGKHSGKALREVAASSPGYVEWMCREIDGIAEHVNEHLDWNRTF
jgi:DNA polymerase-3 subunit epsilon